VLSRAHTLEAGRLDESGKRYERQISDIESGAILTSRDYSQNWQNFAEGELARDHIGLGGSGYHTWLRDVDLNDRQRGVRTELEKRFRSSIVNEPLRDLAPVRPLASSGIAQPAADVAGWGQGQIGAVNRGGPSTNITSDSRDPSLSSLVGDRIAGANERLDGHELDSNLTNQGLHRQAGALFSSVDEAQNKSLGQTFTGLERIAPGGPDTYWAGGDPGNRFDLTGLAQSTGVHIKPGTNVKSLDAHLAPAIRAVAQETGALGLTAPTLTSAQDRHHTDGSLHPEGKALDFRGHNITITQGQALAGRVRQDLGRDYDVQFETFAEDPANNHLHVEYDPKPRRGK
jgi:conjugal transfer mating pair stabilization protein TraG